MSETIACTPESAVFEAPQLQFNEEGWGECCCSRRSVDGRRWRCFLFLLRGFVTLDDFGYVSGPCELPDAFKDIPYQPFSKSDRLGKISDWTGTAQTDKKYPSKLIDLRLVI